MYRKKSLIALIPARGGSKGLQRKNLLPLLGKPLIAWTIIEAKKSRYIDRVILSTEDKEIAEISIKYGAEVPFLRPIELAGDEVSSTDVVLHVIGKLEKKERKHWDYIVLLQPTSPLRLCSDIDEAIDKFFSQDVADALVSVTEVSENPYWMQMITKEGFLKYFIKQKSEICRRQDLPTIYRKNGAIYICKIASLVKEKTFCLKRTIGFVMPREKSIDIDTKMDFKLAEILKKESSYE